MRAVTSAADEPRPVLLAPLRGTANLEKRPVGGSWVVVLVVVLVDDVDWE